jgi:nitronate monooxygenase
MRQFARRVVSPYPIQNALTQQLRKWATSTGDPEHMSLWAGQGVRLVEAGPIERLVERLNREIKDAVRKVNELAR